MPLKMALRSKNEESTNDYLSTNKIMGCLCFISSTNAMETEENRYLNSFNKIKFTPENGFVILINIIKDVCGNVDYIVINKSDINNGHCSIKFFAKFEYLIKKSDLGVIRIRIHNSWKSSKTRVHKMVVCVEFEYRDMNFVIGEECINFRTNTPVIHGNITTGHIIKLVDEYIKAQMKGYKRFPRYISH